MTELLLIGAVIVLVLEFWFWGTRIKEVLQNHKGVPVIPYKPLLLPESAPLVSIIIPAHNEENTIRQSLQSVMDQDYPHYEIIVVNDRSSDATSRIASEMLKGIAGARIIDVDHLPADWTGKCHALAEGVKHAAGEWLAFLDSDSRLEPSGIRNCLATAKAQKVGMVTLTPKFILNTFWERALQPTFAAMSCILYPLGKVNDPDDPTASANGMFYLISRDAYDKINGHHDVKSLAVEDIGIGKRVKAAGLGLTFANGRNVLSTRMYTNFREVMAGWTRILSASMNYDAFTVIKYLLMHIVNSPPVIIASLYLILPHLYSISPGAAVLLPITLFAMIGASCYFLCRDLGVSPLYGSFLALGNLGLIWVFILITVKIFRKDSLQWRGTTYHDNVYEPTALEPN